MIVINSKTNDKALSQAAKSLQAARKAAALTGAGISVGSGIPDFRSPGGLWSVYAPDEYATLDVFYQNPQKAWQLYRALGNVLLGKSANPAHAALAELERIEILRGVVTQNVDNLHQQAGNQVVFEIHGDHQHLQCLQCGELLPVREEHYRLEDMARCSQCAYPLKPNVVLFGEAVRSIDEIDEFISDCDLLLVVGTSAQVYPAAGLPMTVKRNGGQVFEFNQEQTLGRDPFSGMGTITDYFFQGDVVEMLPLLTRVVSSLS
ncbi:MAG: RNA polymerase subunit sigma [Desulfobacterales bacterium]|nr:RNA polymerase subunit sigma [Desulfobacterales bacterium]